jgi:hypothetical protein
VFRAFHFLGPDASPPRREAAPPNRDEGQKKKSNNRLWTLGAGAQFYLAGSCSGAGLRAPERNGSCRALLIKIIALKRLKDALGGLEDVLEI